MMFVRVSVLMRPSRFLSLNAKRYLATSNSFSIPVIDFSKFRSASSREEKKQTAHEIVKAFKESGFIYITNHGVTPGEWEVVLQRKH